jgi:hypothetical protein
LELLANNTTVQVRWPDWKKERQCGKEQKNKREVKRRKERGIGRRECTESEIDKRTKKK